MDKIYIEDLKVFAYHGVFPEEKREGQNFYVNAVLEIDAEKAGIELTESYGMVPASSVCGYYFANDDAHYFSVGNFNVDQINDYANRKSINIEEAKKLLKNRLNY